MKRRLAVRLVRSRLADYPAVALLGPRQCGKTTLARSLSRSYYDAEQPGDRVRLDLAWDDLVHDSKLLVIDEAQTWPELFPRLRAAIDAQRARPGRFLLIGSVSPWLMPEVSESLAGRLALVELSPFLLEELGRNALPKLWLRGGFPDGGSIDARRFPTWQRDYLKLLTQRDLPAWGLPAKPQVTERLLSMLAALHGQVWNASALGQSLGLSYHTVNGYLDHLEGVFLIRRLAPWSGNISKRLIKSPKVYMRDSGLLHAMLGIDDRDALLRHPSAGASWEGFVIEQIIGHLGAHGIPISPHFFRTSDGYEVDLLFELGERRIAVEAKLSSTATPADLARLNKAAELAGAEHRYLVCHTKTPQMSKTIGVASLPALLDRLTSLALPKRRR